MIGKDVPGQEVEDVHNSHVDEGLCQIIQFEGPCWSNESMTSIFADLGFAGRAARTEAAVEYGTSASGTTRPRDHGGWVAEGWVGTFDCSGT